MNTTFAARFKLEVLDRVGEITVIAFDAGLLEAAIKQLSRRADERPAGQILFVAGLLSYEYDFRGFRTLPEDDLSGAAVEITSSTACGVRVELFQTGIIHFSLHQRRTKQF
jgi:hypothetical protein